MIIDSNEALFNYFLPEEINIKSITFKSISFFNSWWTTDFIPEDIYLTVRKRYFPGERERFFPGRGLKEFRFKSGHNTLAEICSEIQKQIIAAGFNFVNLNCDNNNYLILELTEDKEFGFDKAFDVASKSQGNITLFNKWFGFKQEKFTKKGKYYSTKPLPFYVTEIFLRSNLVDTSKTLFNNTPSNIFCIIPVDDSDQIKLQRYEINCTKEINKSTNHIEFELTDKNGKIINFRGSNITLELVIN
ncbi:hypothetical protein [Bartonella sp. CL32QHWL-2]|uniref:hypothetical protein n=2 Tax=unclassified Bartonella TaxID=2645622 RepID=UPI0035D08C03